MKAFFLALTLLATTLTVSAQDLTGEQQKALEKISEEAKAWASNPTVVDAVKAYNSAPSAFAKDMTQPKWEGLPLTDPGVRDLSKNPAGTFLKGKKSDSVSEAFLSGADGGKVALISKTSSWSHKGKPKHDVPMSGKVWTGKPEVDASTGISQVQISVPVMDGGKAIGSLVLGVNPAKLK